MTTTFKTIAIAAMMTVFTTTAFANNNKYNNKNNNRVVNTYAVTNHRGDANHHQNNISMAEYNNAKRCHCKTCKDIVKAYEAQMKHHKNNNRCNCQNCQKPGAVTNAHVVTSGHMANTPQAGHTANVPQAGHTANVPQTGHGGYAHH